MFLFHSKQRGTDINVIIHLNINDLEMVPREELNPDTLLRLLMIQKHLASCIEAT
jgi:hypothetical protein